MKPTEFHTSAQAVETTVEQPVSGPVRIDPSLFKLVSGGLPKGGWEIEPVVQQSTPTT